MRKDVIEEMKIKKYGMKKKAYKKINKNLQ